ncbi:MAG: hypothetical protein QXQ94_04480 [Candidatus Bathyarchaeia archaeon]
MVGKLLLVKRCRKVLLTCGLAFFGFLFFSLLLSFLGQVQSPPLALNEAKCFSSKIALYTICLKTLLLKVRSLLMMILKMLIMQGAYITQKLGLITFAAHVFLSFSQAF